jgi:hypothetical protein
MAEAKHETKHEPRHRRSQRAARRDEPYQHDPYLSDVVGLSRLTLAVGGSATEFASGAVRVAGGLLTDLLSTVLDPIDRIIGSGSRRERLEAEDEEEDRYREPNISRAISRALSAATETVNRSEERFREVMEASPDPEQRPEEPPSTSSSH